MADTMIGLKRTHYCADLSTEEIGQEVVVCGWVQRTRELGALTFIDLRDRTGIIQLAFDEATPPELFKKAGGCRAEFVLCAKGTVRKRESINPDIKTGLIEVFVEDLRVLSRAQTPPFEITDKTNVGDELRLKYRYLDLRRTEMQDTILTRHRVVKAVRDFFDREGFVDVETPILIKSTPEGARDYLVPSRVQPGKFYALPQSPQLYKQLLMLSGFDRYMQIARCFRDEDLRANRQPEFTQIDCEMSFVTQEDVLEINERFIQYLFQRILDVEISLPLPRLRYAEAMDRFGSDKPDTRFGLELCDLGDLLQNTECGMFRDALQAGGTVRAINAKGLAAAISRKEIDKLTDYVKTYRAKGLAYTRLTADAETSSYEKFLTPEETAAIRERLGAETGDLLFISADPNPEVVLDALGALRLRIAQTHNLIPAGQYNFLWITDFPLLEWDEDSGRFSAKHHPFTSPNLEDLDKLESDPASVRAIAYDMVLNGEELGGGSIRINDPSIQERMFGVLGFSKEDAHRRFGYLIDAFQYGAPPHGGIAYGLDRLVMSICGKDSIRDVIAFPKLQNASELMTACPAVVDQSQLEELGIMLAAPAPNEA